MAGISRLEALRLRKELLVTRCEVQRLTIAFEIRKIQQASSWMRLAMSGLKNLSLLIPAVDLVSNPRRRRVSRVTATAVLGWRLLKRIREAMRATNGHGSKKAN